MKVSVIPELCCGDDLAIVNAARRSFGVHHSQFRTDADGPRTPNGVSDESLLRELIRGGHWLPFRHCQLAFECDAPIPVARQLGKHQVGMNWSEISRRYKTKGITFYSFNGMWRADVEDRRQGSGKLLPDTVQARLNSLQARNIMLCVADYERALQLGAAPEQARFLLPQSMEVVWTWSGSYLAWCHMWSQRTHPDAQRETETFVRMTEGAIAARFPYSWPMIRARHAAQWSAAQ